MDWFDKERQSNKPCNGLYICIDWLSLGVMMILIEADEIENIRSKTTTWIKLFISKHQQSYFVLFCLVSTSGKNKFHCNCKILTLFIDNIPHLAPHNWEDSTIVWITAGKSFSPREEFWIGITVRALSAHPCLGMAWSCRVGSSLLSTLPPLPHYFASRTSEERRRCYHLYFGRIMRFCVWCSEALPEPFSPPSVGLEPSPSLSLGR